MHKLFQRCSTLGLSVIFAVAASSGLPAAAASKKITVNYEGAVINLENAPLTLIDGNNNRVDPFTYNGTTYLPMRVVAKALGLNVSYDGTSKTVTLTTAPAQTTTETPQETAPPTASEGNLPPAPPDGTPPAIPTPGGIGLNGTHPDGPPPGNPPDGATPGAIGVKERPSAPPSDGAGTVNPPTNQSSSAAGSGQSSFIGKKNIDVSFVAIKIILDGSEVALTDANGKAITPFEYNGTIYLPLRALSQLLGLQTSYDSSQKLIKITRP